MKRTLWLFSALTIFLAGMVCQRFYGLGNLVSLSAVQGIPEPPDLTGRRCEVFLLAGQSNMEGSGRMDRYKPPSGNLARRIFVINEDYRLLPAGEPVQKSGVGPSVAFAARYLELQGDDELCLVLVPAARGGTNIEKWKPSRNESSLYAKAVRRTLSASHFGPVRGLLWFQGENDAEGKPEDHAEDWDLHFTRLCEAFRADLGDPLRIVYARIGPGDERTELVRTAQERVNLENTAMITVDDLKYVRGVHYDTATYLEIGRRFAEAMFASE